MAAQDILTQWGQYFAQSNFFTDPIVWISWWIVDFLKVLVDAANYLLQSVYKISDFIFTDTVADFIRSFNVVLWIPFVIALLILGYTLIFHTTDTRPKVVQNLLIAVMVICALPTMMVAVKDMTFAGVDVVNNYSISGEENTDLSYSDKIVLDNLADLKYMESQKWDENSLIRKKNNLKTLKGIDITERLWADKEQSTDSVFDKYLNTDENGNVTVQNIDRSSWIWLFSKVYYRYNFNFLAMILALLASAIALFFTAYKIARLIWELAVHQLLAIIFAASDLTSGQRIKQVLRSMASIFVVIFLTSILLQFFQLGVQYINNQNINGLVRGFILLFWALACVDAPNIIERILGIDAGISSGFRTFFGVAHGARTVSNTAKSVGRGIGKVGGKVGSKVKSTATKSGRAVDGFSTAKTKAANGAAKNDTKSNAKNNSYSTENQSANNRKNNVDGADTKDKSATVNGYTAGEKKSDSQTSKGAAAENKNQKSQKNAINGYQVPKNNQQQNIRSNGSSSSSYSAAGNYNKNRSSENVAKTYTVGGKNTTHKSNPSWPTQKSSFSDKRTTKPTNVTPDRSNLKTPKNNKKGE